MLDAPRPRGRDAPGNKTSNPQKKTTSNPCKPGDNQITKKATNPSVATSQGNQEASKKHMI